MLGTLILSSIHTHSTSLSLLSLETVLNSFGKDFTLMLILLYFLNWPASILLKSDYVVAMLWSGEAVDSLSSDPEVEALRLGGLAPPPTLWWCFMDRLAMPDRAVRSPMDPAAAVGSVSAAVVAADVSLSFCHASM